MRYAFVSLSIIAIWLAVILIVVSLNYKQDTLPIIALIMTVILFEIGFKEKK